MESDFLRVITVTDEDDCGNDAIACATKKANAVLSSYPRERVVSVTPLMTSYQNSEQVVWTRFAITIVVVE